MSDNKYLLSEDVCLNCGHEQWQDDELWEQPSICDLCLEDTKKGD